MDKEFISVQKIIPGGQGLGELSNGKKVFVWGAIPGEIVTDYQILKNKSHYLEIRAIKIENQSKHRVEPKDNVYLSTSPWQIIDYNYELKLKQELVVELFREHNINIETHKIFTDNKDYFYRNKMEYALYWDKELNTIKLALHERGSHRKIPIITSSIEKPEIFHRAKEIIDELNSRGEEARKYQSLLLRCNRQGEVSGGLYENGKSHPKFPNLTDTILGKKYSYSPNGFFQINLPVYEMALKEIKTHIKTDKVLDLYAGVGTIGLSVARNHNLTLVEVNKYAFEEMCKNCAEGVFEGGSEAGKPRVSAETPVATGVSDAPRKNLLQAIFAKSKNSLDYAGVSDALREKGPFIFLAKSEDSLDYINYDQTVILDPPRAGCDKKLIEKLVEITPECIIYLSCNPATQARDIKLLLEKYQIQDIKTFNFFPHTPHIENLVILQRK